MKHFLAVLAVVFGCFVAGGFARAGECPNGMSTERQFFKSVADQKLPVSTLDDDATTRFVKRYNEISKLGLTDNARVYFSPHVANGQPVVGVVIMQDGCVVAGTIEVLPPEAFFGFLESAAVLPVDIQSFAVGDEL